MKCFDINSGEVTRGLPITNLDGISFGSTFLPFHPTLLKHGGEACFGNSLVNVDITKVFRDPGYKLMAVTPNIDDDSALVRLDFCISSGGVSNFSSVTVSEWNPIGDAEEILSGTSSTLIGSGFDFVRYVMRVCAVRIGKGSKMELKLATKVTQKRWLRKPKETITLRTVTYSYDGKKVTIETTTALG